jgi:FkbM family methyltransferase
LSALPESLRLLAGRLGARLSRDLFRRDYLRSLKFDVKTIVDVGVHRGTKPLYEAFPDCLFVLVDPQRDCELMLLHRPARYVVVNSGLAAEAGRRVLFVQGAGKTTFLERTALTAAPTLASYDVDTMTLDMLLGSIAFEPPIGLKIDTEGFELEVLKGLDEYLSSVQFIICEASIRRRFVGSYQISELVAYLWRQGFVLFNFLNGPVERPRYYDLLFVPRTSPLLD